MTETLHPSGEAPRLAAEPPAGRSKRWTVRLGRVAEKVDPDSERDVCRVARLLGTTANAIRDAIDAARVAAASAPPPAPAVPLKREPVTVLVRRVDETDDRARVFSDFQAAIDAARTAGDADRVILKWPAKSAHRLVALDVDVAKPFDLPDLMGRASGRAAPRPAWSWLTRSGGFRFVFENDLGDYGLTATERAGLFALLVPSAVGGYNVERVEVKCDTRCPPAGSAVMAGWGYGVSDLRGALLRTGGAGEVSEHEVEDYLAEHGLEVGQRYSHDRCPINPGPISGTDPVQVTDEGIKCYRCDADGNGWRPWSRLIDNDGADEPERDPIVEMALRWVHWAHARLVLVALRPLVPESLREAGYRALLRVVHDDEMTDEGRRAEKARARLDRVLAPDLRVVRGRGAWLHVGSWNVHTTITRESLRTLPALSTALALDTAMGTEALPGFVPVEPVHFVATEPTWRESEGCVWVPRKLVGVEPAEEMTYDQALTALASAVPGVSPEWLGLVYLLVLAMVRAQLSLATPPTLLVTGPPGSGKGFSVHVACALLGVEPHRLRFNGARDLGLSIGEGIRAGAPILFGDEVGKAEGFWRQSAPILELGPTFSWRGLHVGGLSAPFKSAVVLGGSTLPRGLTTMQELARRLALFDLPPVPAEVSGRWDGAICSYFGVPTLAALRSSPWGAAVGDAYLARARAEVLSEQLPPWVEQAQAHGARPLSDDDDARELADLVRRLWEVWTSGEERVPSDAAKFRGWLRGWHDGVSGPHRAAEALAGYFEDDDTPAAREAKLGRLETADVAKAVGLPPGARVSLRAKAHGRRVALRFLEGGTKRLELRAADPTLPGHDVAGASA